jgi:lysine 2,3-aminomutase
LRNFEGVITTYPEPENYIPGRAESYFEGIYPNMDDKQSNIGIAGLMNDKQFNLVPEGLNRLSRRKNYETDPAHSTLKDKRGKRDELKEKKYQAQQQKNIDVEETSESS